MARRYSSKPKQEKQNVGKVLFIAFILLLAMFLGIVIGGASYIIKDTPDISHYSYGDWKSPETTMIYNIEGELIDRLFRENREYVPIAKIPRHLQDAVVAIEDYRFFRHHGIDFWSIPRAVLIDLKERSFAQGFSTLTMQLARNVYLTKQKKIYRKLQEMFLAIQFERLYTKREILEFYLNEIFLGHSAYGVQAAAHQYYGKDVWELSLCESALLAGILQAPNSQSPYNNKQAALRRQHIVLNRMVELGYINQAEADAARDEPIVLTGIKETSAQFAPYFIRYVREQLLAQFGPQLVYGGGLRVYTTLDSRLQEIAENTVNDIIENNTMPSIDRAGDGLLQPQLALVTVDSKTGYIKAMIGGRGTDQWNRATQSRRQPGSAFKPIIYAAALEEGLSPGTPFLDYPTTDFSEHTIDEVGNIIPWPRNFNNQYCGLVTLRDALDQSMNVVAVKLLNEIGINKGFAMAERLGVSKLGAVDKNLGISLGGLTHGITPLEMAKVFATFANQGIQVEPTAILRVEDGRGNILYQATPKRKIVLSEEVAFILTDMLTTAVNSPYGTGRRARLSTHPVAGKTGTTNNSTDAWFVGYTPDLVTSIWVGEDNPYPMDYNPILDQDGNIKLNPNTGLPTYQLTLGSWITAEIWGQYMRQATESMPPSKFPGQPVRVTKVTIDPVTGLLPGEFAPEVIEEYFIRGTEPTETETFHEPLISVDIDIETGLLATPNCPKENIRTYQYQRFSHIRITPDGSPMPLFDPHNEVPLKDENGQILYEKMPTDSCWVHDTHQRKEEPSQDFLEKLWDFFFKD